MSETIAKILSEQQRREFQIAPEVRSAINVEARTVELSFSSEAPVPRWFGNEVLDHSEKAVDLSRLRQAAPLLLNHDPAQQIGVVETCAISDKRGRATVRFSKSALGQEIFQDVQDGIRSLVSVGYRVREMELMKKEGKEETYRATKWEPLEISIVSIPADTSVGVGRSENTTLNNMKINTPLQDAATAPDTRGGGAPAPAVGPSAVELRAEGARAERERTTAIRQLCAQAKLPQLAEEHVTRGSTVEDVRLALWEKMTNATPLTPSERKPELGLTDKEIQKYSLVRALNLLANKKPLDGFELECSQGVAEKTRRTPEGFFIPHDVVVAKAQQRAMNATTATQGGFLVGTDLQTGSMIELLRNATVFDRLGARNLSGLVGNVAIPRVTGGATAYWVSETTAVTESTPAIGQLALTPKKLGGYTQYTKQLLSQSSPDVEGFIRSDLMTVLAIEKDRACINGLGAAGEPLGVLNTTGIGSVTFGAAATWAKILSFESAVEIANALNGKISYLTTPATKAKWKAALKVAAVSGFLWENGDIVNGYSAFSSNQVPSDKVIFGNFGDFITADWDGMDVTVDPYSLATQGLVKIVIFIMTDNGARHAVSFVASTDSGAQ